MGKVERGGVVTIETLCGVGEIRRGEMRTVIK